MAEKWMKKRHSVMQNLARVFIGAYGRLKFHVKVTPFPDKTGQYVILMNHQTDFDQFFVGMAFRQTLYFMATEDIFSNGFISSLLRWATAPIPIKKQTSDLRAVMTVLRVAKEGATIALAPEGNRTYSGRTTYIRPAIVGMVRKMKLPIALFRIEGGFGVQPRWADGTRKGPMTAGVSRVITPEEYENMTDEELLEVINKEMWVDENKVDHEYICKSPANYMERALYICPHCGFSTFTSKGDIVECNKCHRQVRYLPTKEMEGVGFDHPFRFFGDWYDYQYDYLNHTDTTVYTEEPLFTDRGRMSEVIVYKNKVSMYKNAEFRLYGDRIVINEGCDDQMVFPFSDVTALSVLGRNKANIYWNKRVFQIRGDKRFNALKYVNIYYRSRNIMKGENDAEFLGL